MIKERKSEQENSGIRTEDVLAYLDRLVNDDSTVPTNLNGILLMAKILDMFGEI